MPCTAGIGPGSRGCGGCSIAEVPGMTGTAFAGTQDPARPSTLRLRPMATRRRSAVAAVSALVAVSSTAVVASAFAHAGATSAVLALRTTVAAGVPISTADLRVVQVHVASGVAVVPAAEEGQVVGRQAAANMPVGSLLAPGDLVTAFAPPPGSAVVGVAAAPGALPAGGVSVGDEVDVVATGSASASGPAAGTPGASSGAAAQTDSVVVAGPAPVVAVASAATATTSGGGALVVSVVVPIAIAPMVAALSASGGAALVIVGPGS